MLPNEKGFVTKKTFLYLPDTPSTVGSCLLQTSPYDAYLTQRARFPNGLEQPEDGFRLSIDALLLAAFAHRILPGNTDPVADLGTGSGGCLIALGLLRDTFQGTGFEQENACITCAQKNVQNLGLAQRLSLVHLDLDSKKALSPFHAHFAACLANPPFYAASEGRPSKENLRNRALRTKTPFTPFIASARVLLRYHGYLFLIVPPAKIQPVCSLLEKNTFGVRTLLPVANFKNEKIIRILLCARKSASSDTVFEQPLILHYREDQNKIRYTTEATAFCPWLSS